MDKGLMPNLQRLVNEGVCGNLATLDPAYSPMLWTSIATGKRPYKHGVHGFMEALPDGKTVRPVMSTTRTCKALWNIATQNNLKTHVVGWWPSHPAEPINGIMVSNYFQHANKSLSEEWTLAPGAVHPLSKMAYFGDFRVHPEELTTTHLQPFVPEVWKIDQSTDHRLSSIAQVTCDAASLQAAFTHILRTEEWDFAACYFAAIDHYCHGFMRYNPPKRDHIPQEDYDLYKDVVAGVIVFTT